MSNDNSTEVRRYLGVMVSSTFTDLKNHREALIKVIEGQQLKPIAMEHDSAKPAGDVIDSSLQMVRDSAAYIGVISHKYGQIPVCAIRNPNNLSLTELEFQEARRLDRPILIFIMGEEHDVKLADVEKDEAKIMKLTGFRENAKRLREDSSIHRIYKSFNSLHEFEVAATQSVAELRRHLDKFSPPLIHAPHLPVAGDSTKTNPIPIPPTFYARPPYIGSHTFVGRASQLETLNEWASPADPHPLLLYEAIGGSGKSMLTWEWVINHATVTRGDWAGRFWYSFYERGATMADFCRRALAYMTGRSHDRFRGKTLPSL